MENTVALSELTELIGSVRGLVESQGNTEKRLFQMIEDSEKRSIQRDDDLRGLIKELKEEVQGEVRIVKNDLTPLKDESTGRKYHAGKMWTQIV